MVEAAGLTLSVIESIPVHEAISYPRPTGYQPPAPPVPSYGPPRAHTSQFPAGPGQMASQPVYGIEQRQYMYGPVPCERPDTTLGYFGGPPTTFSLSYCSAVVQATVQTLPSRVSPGAICVSVRDPNAYHVMQALCKR